MPRYTLLFITNKPLRPELYTLCLVGISRIFSAQTSPNLLSNFPAMQLESYGHGRSRGSACFLLGLSRHVEKIYKVAAVKRRHDQLGVGAGCMGGRFD